jgi:hypothetical protein
MRRFGTLLAGALLLATMHAHGPAAAGVSAQQPNLNAAGFPCGPRGTLEGSPTTTLSSAVVNFENPSNSSLTCLFRNMSLPSSFGGPCQFKSGPYTVDFQIRLLLRVNSNSYLICSGGTITVQTFTLSTTVSNFNGRDTRTFDLIDYGGTQCTNQVEDGATACTAQEVATSVVTVNLQDEAPFQYTCPGASPVTSTGSGPYTGTCSVTMDANKSITVVGDYIP